MTAVSNRAAIPGRNPKFPDLKRRKFWGSGLWSKGTFYSSVGGVSEEAVKRYIETQKDRG